MYIYFVIAYNISVAVDATEEKVMARSQQNCANKTANKTSKSNTTKGAAKSSTKNCSNCK